MCFEPTKWRGYELVTYRSTEFSAICVNINNSLSTSFAGTKVQIIVERKKLFAENLQKNLGKGKCCYKWQRLPFLFPFVLTSQLLVDSRYDHRLHNPSQVFVIFERDRQSFLKILYGCIHYLVHLATVWNQPVVFPKLDDEILNNSTKIRSLSIFQFIVALSLIHRWRKSVYINKTQIAVVTSCIIFIKWLKVYQGCFLTLKGLRIIYQIVP